LKKMIGLCVVGLALAAPLCQAQTSLNPAMTLVKMDPAKEKSWLALWDKAITFEATHRRECDRLMGERIAWGITPIVDGFYYGYMATKNTKYVDMLVDWADSLIKRAVKEPDGYVGWPAKEAAGTWVDDLDRYDADSMLAEAMVFRPIVLMAGQMMKDPSLKEKYGAKGESYLRLAEQLYAKWIERGGWRETGDGGLISVVMPYGLDPTHRKWMDFDTRNAPGHGASHPDNKANQVAQWMLAMWDVTGKPEYRDHAERWFKVQKSRMKPKSDGTYEIWNYWQPAGPWDYKPDGSPKHWVGVHPNGGYYDDDMSGIVAAYEHDLVFTREDIARLVATAKTSWQENDPSYPPPGFQPIAGMLVSIEPRTGTAKEVNASFPNSMTKGPLSAGPGALYGTVASISWDERANTGKIVVAPGTPQSASVTLTTNKETKIKMLRMWTPLVPYDVEIQKYYEAIERPDDWFGASTVPYYLMLQAEIRAK
jgi:hypothetical protein